MHNVNKGLLIICACSTAFSAFSQDSLGYFTNSGIKIVPLFKTNFEHVDNIGRFSDAENPESSTVMIIEPGVVLSSDRNGNQYQIAYQLSSGTYFDSSEDNFIDHRFTTNNFIQVNRRNGMGLNYSYLALHEERGTGILAGDDISILADGPAKYGLHNINATYVYGAEGSKGRIESNIRYENKKYKNYRNVTVDGFGSISTKYKDYDEVGGGVTFYFQALPHTQLLIEYDVARRDFELNDPITGESQDNINSYYYLGAKWDVTGKTDGKLRVGLQDKSYEDTNKPDFDGFSWNVEVNWKPLNYSTFTLSASQDAIEPSQGSNYIDQTSFDGSWKHFWLTNLYSYLSLTVSQDDYSESERDDDLVKSAFALGYELRDLADISAGWRNENNDSSIKTNTYDQNVWYLSVELIF